MGLDSTSVSLYDSMGHGGSTISNPHTTMEALSKNHLECLETRERIARFIRLGFVTDEIARRLRLNPMIVRFHETKIKEMCERNIKEEYKSHVIQAYEMYKDILREAYIAHEQMKMEGKKLESGFLRVMNDAQAHICKLLGLNAPTRIIDETGQVQPDWNKIIAETDTNIIHMTKSNNPNVSA